MKHNYGVIRNVLIAGLSIIFSGCVSTDFVQQMVKDIDSLKSENSILRNDITELNQRLDKVELISAESSETPVPDEQVSILDLLALTNGSTSSRPEKEPEISRSAAISGEELYSRAQAHYSEHRYREAAMTYIQAKLLDDNPEFQARCDYWTGECMFAQGAYQRALESFAEVFVKHGSTTKAPDALLKIGFTYYEMHNYNGARLALDEFVKRFPNHRAVQFAEEKLRWIDNLESGDTQSDR
ncbi:tetratricopeptide repeat protein [bacterium]|nr:tetratricopeptide repeat protein [bacterium]